MAIQRGSLVTYDWLMLCRRWKASSASPKAAPAIKKEKATNKCALAFLMLIRPELTVAESSSVRPPPLSLSFRPSPVPSSASRIRACVRAWVRTEEGEACDVNHLEDERRKEGRSLRRTNVNREVLEGG